MPGKKTDAPWELSEVERKRLRKWLTEHYPHLLKRSKRLWAECRDWHLKHAQQAVNWEAAYRAWVRKADEFAADKARRNGRERPQEQAPRGEQPERIGNVIQGLFGREEKR